MRMPLRDRDSNSNVRVVISASAPTAARLEPGASPMEVKSSAGMSRRTVLIAAAAAGPALALGRAQAAALPKSAVAYQDTPKDGKDCKGCNPFIPPSSCKLVTGTISPNGWCKLWVAKG